MQEKLQKIKDSFEKKLKSIKDLDSLDILYNEYFSRKAGEMTNIMKSLKDLSGEERKEMGALSNTVKTEMESLFENKN